MPHRCARFGDGEKDGASGNTSALIFGKHAPAHLIDRLVMPCPVPKQDRANRRSFGPNDDLEHVRGFRTRSVDVASVPFEDLLVGLRSPEMLQHRGIVEAEEERKIAVTPRLESHPHLLAPVHYQRSG